MHAFKAISNPTGMQSRLAPMLKRLVRSVSSLSGEFGTSAFSFAMLVFLVQEARATALSQDATLAGQPMDTSDLDAVRQVFGDAAGDQVAGIDYTAIADAVARISDLYAREALAQEASGEDLTTQEPAAGAEQGVLDAELEVVGRYLQDAVQYAQLSTEGVAVEGAEAVAAGEAAASAGAASAGLAAVLPALVALVGVAALGSSGSTSSTSSSVNHAPTVAAALISSALEAAASYSLNLLSGASDVDTTDSLSLSGVTYKVGGAAASGTVPAGLSLSSAGVLTVDPTSSAFNYLAAGDTLAIVVSYTISDGKGGTVAQTATITITGTNDAPTFASQGPTTVSENGAAFNLSLLAGASDADAGETATLTVDQLLYKVGAATATTTVPNGLSLSADGKTLVITPGTFSYLNDGQTLNIVISYHVKDVNGAYVEVTTTVTVNGSGTVSTETKSNPGTVVNGYISGATVFQDLNGDGVWQEGEPKTTTGADGTFNLNVIEGNSSPIVMFGGTDLSTGLAYTNILKGPVGSSTITPLTTLVSSLMSSGQTQAEALSAMLKAFGLPEGFDLLNFDPVAKADDPDFAAVALQVKAAGVLVANLMDAGGNALAGASGGDASALSSTMAASIAAKLAALGSGGLAALADSSTLLAILNASASSAGLSGTALTNFNAVASAGASGIAAVNTMITDAVAAGGSVADIFAAIARAQTIAQGSLGDSIAASAASGVSTIKSAAELQAAVNAVVTPNNAPTVGDPLTGKAIEAGEIVTLNLLSGARDLDVGETAKLSLTGVTYKVGTATASSTVPAGLSLSSAGVLTIDPTNAAFNALAAGQTQTITVSYTISDGKKDGTVAQTATITITGTNDAPTVGAALSAAATEAGDSLTLDLLSGASDVDTTDSLSLSGVTYKVGGAAASGTVPAGLSLSSAGVLTVDPTNAAFNALAAGQTQTITVSYTISDGKGGTVAQTATITVTGAAQTAVISLATAQSLYNANTFYSDDDNVTVDITTSAISAAGGLSGLSLSKLGALGVDVVDIGGSATNATLHINSADTLAMSDAGLSFAAGDTITLDVALEEGTYQNDASGSYLSGNLQGSSGGLGLADLSLTGLGVDVIDIVGNAGALGNYTAHITAADAANVADAGVHFAAGDNITLDVSTTDLGASGSYLSGSLNSAISGMSDGLSLSQLGALGVDVIDIGGPDAATLHLSSLTDFIDMASAGLRFGATDTVDVDSTHQSFSSAKSFGSTTTAEQLASAVGDSLGLHAIGIDKVAVDTGVMVTLHEDAGMAFGADQSLKDLLIALGDSGVTADDMSHSLDAVSAVVVSAEANFAIDDAMVSALMDAGLLTANTDSTIEVDTTSDYMSTSLSQLADIGADKVVTSQDVVYVDLGDDVANVHALSTLLAKLASDDVAAKFVHTDGAAVAEVGLVLSADQAALATAIESSSSVLDQLTSAGITELLVACDDTHTTAEVTLLGQDYYKVPVSG